MCIRDRFQVVLFAVALVRGWFGEGGLLATGAVLGLTDVDALTISMTRSASTGIPPDTAARAIAIGIVANSAMKATIAGVLGDRGFAARTGGVLAAMAAAVVGVAASAAAAAAVATPRRCGAGWTPCATCSRPPSA